MNLENKQLLVGLGVILLILAGIFFWKNKRAQQLEPGPSAEEVMIHQEEGMVRKNEEGTQVMTEEEVKKLREEIDGVLSGEDMSSADLKDVSGGGTSGKAKKAFSDGKFYHKVEASGLGSLEKGFYYEGWLMKADGSYISTGRVETDAFGNGVLYYLASSDKSEYSKVAVTLEPEDGNPQPAKHILEGEF